VHPHSFQSNHLAPLYTQDGQQHQKQQRRRHYYLPKGVGGRAGAAGKGGSGLGSGAEEFLTEKRSGLLLLLSLIAAGNIASGPKNNTPLVSSVGSMRASVSLPAFAPYRRV
jgi:hypothetical protein